MIVGIGCDLANINRFEKALAKFGGRFVNRAFSEREKAELKSSICRTVPAGGWRKSAAEPHLKSM